MMNGIKRFAAVAGAVALAVSCFGTAATAKTAKPLVVGTDAAGDWGQAVDPTLAPVGDALGQDLTGASISGDAKTLNFVISLNSLPPTGGVPEISRYTWDFNVGKLFTELDGKFTNYSRGACDPTAGNCPPPRDPGLQPFSVRGDCGVASDTGTTVTTCKEIGLVQATFDAAAGTITIPVPAAMIHAKPGSKITPAANLFGGSISAAPAAFFTSSAMPIDTLVVTKTFTVPR
ncbi:MAG TPA: hypothetical protein VFK89_08205 [Actinomycetota bacterium]|nr:hypothetical protein [Actinomycetota bacterium]